MPRQRERRGNGEGHLRPLSCDRHQQGHRNSVRKDCRERRIGIGANGTGESYANKQDDNREPYKMIVV